MRSERDIESGRLRSTLERLESGSRPPGGVRADGIGVPSIGGENITRSGTLVLDDVKLVPEAFFRNMPRGLVECGDVLINKDGAQTGKVARYRGEFQEASINEHVFLLRAERSAASGDFLFWALFWPETQRQIAKAITGSAQPGLKQGFADDVWIPLPPKPEQRQISEILDTLDEAIRETEGIIAKLKQVKQGLLHDLLTRGIDDNGELRDPERHPDQFKDSPLGRIPKEWEVDRLEHLTTRIVDGVHHTPTYVERGVPFLTVQNLTRTSGISLEPQRFVSERAHAEYRRRADPGAGDVLVSKDGTLGVARVVPEGLPEFSIFVSIALLRPRRDRVKPEMICEFFATASYERQLATQSAGTGLKHIHLEHFRRFLLRLPPMAEQEQIIAVLRAQDTRMAEEVAGLEKLRLLKQGLMEDLLTGRVRVTKLLEEVAE